MLIAYLSGLRYVRYWRTSGIFMMGVVRPDISMKGIITMTDPIMACCIFLEIEEINRPIPTDAARNSIRPMPGLKYPNRCAKCTNTTEALRWCVPTDWKKH